MSEATQGASSSSNSLAPYLFYGDLNCPYCHAQNERILDLGAERRVEWRGVRHMPHLPVPAKNTALEREDLQREVQSVRLLEVALSISVPPARPNTDRATCLVAAARRVDRVRADALKTFLYRALWLHARDISDSAVLDELRRLAGLPELVVGDADRKAVDAWQMEWEQGGFDRRIPVIVSPRGGKLLGLGERGRLEVFLRSGIMSAEGSGHCS